MKVNKLQVFFHERLVGTLAKTAAQKIAFEYADSWLEGGFPISPFSLPLKKQVFVPEKPYFQGLFGVFADSLPDAWGNLLLNRLLRKHGVDPGELSVLDRLAIVGDSGMGALTYRPEIILEDKVINYDLDVIAGECKKLLATEYSDHLDGLYRMGGTSGGVRPKIMTSIGAEHWIIKFPAHVDEENSGEREFAYYRCARACGIDMTESRLFPSKICSGYFGTKRFDREMKGEHVQRIHMLTVAAILERDFEQPSLDYNTLMKLTKILTFSNKQELEKMYRLMCFNVFAHNRDDHAKNFSFLYDEEKDLWRLSPAYDLTYSNTYFGEHTTSVDGNGKNPGMKELISVGVNNGMKKDRCVKLAEEVKQLVEDMLLK